MKWRSLLIGDQFWMLHKVKKQAASCARKRAPVSSIARVSEELQCYYFSNCYFSTLPNLIISGFEDSNVRLFCWENGIVLFLKFRAHACMHAQSTQRQADRHTHYIMDIFFSFSNHETPSPSHNILLPPTVDKHAWMHTHLCTYMHTHTHTCTQINQSTPILKTIFKCLYLGSVCVIVQIPNQVMKFWG